MVEQSQSVTSFLLHDFVHLLRVELDVQVSQGRLQLFEILNFRADVVLRAELREVFLLVELVE